MEGTSCYAMRFFLPRRSWQRLAMLLASSQSPYTGQESCEIKALSPQEISDLLAGKGMGFAKAAELNGYPGPAHVLEPAAQLQLTPEQIARTEALFSKMQTQAVGIGQQLVEEERVVRSFGNGYDTSSSQAHPHRPRHCFGWLAWHACCLPCPRPR